MYQREVDVDILNAVGSVLADVSSASPSSEQGALTNIFTILTTRQSITISTENSSSL